MHTDCKSTSYMYICTCCGTKGVLANSCPLYQMLTKRLVAELRLGLRLMTAQLNSFALAAKPEKVLSEERVKKCHCGVTKFVVKALHTFSTVDFGISCSKQLC